MSVPTCILLHDAHGYICVQWDGVLIEKVVFNDELCRFFVRPGVSWRGLKPESDLLWGHVIMLLRDWECEKSSYQNCFCIMISMRILTDNSVMVGCHSDQPHRSDCFEQQEIAWAKWFPNFHYVPREIADGFARFSVTGCTHKDLKITNFLIFSLIPLFIWLGHYKLPDHVRRRTKRFVNVLLNPT